MFCSARFSALEPPWTLNCGDLPVTKLKMPLTAETAVSMLRSTWYLDAVSGVHCSSLHYAALGNCNPRRAQLTLR
jgi:hypothetical protein